MQFKLKYDLNGNCIEESSDAGYLVKRQYDEKNNLKKELIKDWQTGEFNETTFFYNENNEVITEKYSQGKQNTLITTMVILKILFIMIKKVKSKIEEVTNTNMTNIKIGLHKLHIKMARQFHMLKE